MEILPTLSRMIAVTFSMYASGNCCLCWSGRVLDSLESVRKAAAQMIDVVIRLIMAFLYVIMRSYPLLSGCRLAVSIVRVRLYHSGKGVLGFHDIFTCFTYGALPRFFLADVVSMLLYDF